MALVVICGALAHIQKSIADPSQSPVCIEISSSSILHPFDGLRQKDELICKIDTLLGSLRNVWFDYFSEQSEHMKLLTNFLNERHTEFTMEYDLVPVWLAKKEINRLFMDKFHKTYL